MDNILDPGSPAAVVFWRGGTPVNERPAYGSRRVCTPAGIPRTMDEDVTRVRLVSLKPPGRKNGLAEEQYHDRAVIIISFAAGVLAPILVMQTQGERDGTVPPSGTDKRKVGFDR